VISVIIPTWNGAADLEACLPAIAAQDIDEEVEILVTDSSSTDATVDVARRHGADVTVIRKEDFDHAGTRNATADRARGDVLVFISQDAIPASRSWLAQLVAPLRAGDRTAGVYGRQAPKPGCIPPEAWFLGFLYGTEARRQRAATEAELTMDTTLFSNANSAVRRDVWEEHRFPERMLMSEDQHWARRVLLAGWEIAYEPGAAVLHSHTYTLASAFRRFFDSGATAADTYMAGGEAADSALRSSAVAYARGEIAYLRRTHNLRWLPYTLAYEAAKLAGLQLGRRHRRLPRSVVRRCSAFPTHWAASSGKGTADR
jgi:rhamnosyltransferase